MLACPLPGVAAPIVGAPGTVDAAAEKVKSSAGVFALVPLAVVTSTSTTPAPAGLVAVQVVVELQFTPVSATPPKLTVVPPMMKLLPVIVTTVPPLEGPLVGVIDVTAGAPMKVKSSTAVFALVPPAVVTSTFTTPVPAGLVAVQVVVEVQFTPVAATPPKLTVVAPMMKFEPLMVTRVPPLDGPDVGVIDVTAGTGMKVKSSAAVLALVPPAVVTSTLTTPEPLGLVAVQVVVELQFTAAAATPPRVTVVPPTTKFVPVMVTTVPPPVGPLVGAMEVTVGT